MTNSIPCLERQSLATGNEKPYGAGVAIFNYVHVDE